MVNLRELDIDSVTLSGAISLDRDDGEHLRVALQKHQENWPRRSIDKFGLYTSDDVRHHIHLDLEVRRRVNPSLALIYVDVHPIPSRETIRAQTREKQEREFHELMALLLEFQMFNLTMRMHAHIDWDFLPDTHKPIVGLPLMSIQNPNVPFSEISGVRLKRSTENGPISVILDLQEDRSLTATLRFPFTQTISSSLVERIVQQGTEYIHDFVTEVGEVVS